VFRIVAWRTSIDMGVGEAKPETGVSPPTIGESVGGNRLAQIIAVVVLGVAGPDVIFRRISSLLFG
jgi:hypothetical protein